MLREPGDNIVHAALLRVPEDSHDLPFQRSQRIRVVSDSRLDTKHVTLRAENGAVTKATLRFGVLNCAADSHRLRTNGGSLGGSEGRTASAELLRTLNRF